ncbi:MAG: ribosome small subunit-dependent GTPase A [Bacteroidetes bacterium]|jgi:ribosome biogenesis GTPase|nr:ribosome small subunit-dependent GTPase A [Bacteroidota bacterium]
MKSQHGIVTKTTGSIITVRSDKEVVQCRIKGNFRIKDIDATNPVAVGDEVAFENGFITQLLPRRNYIIRKSKKLSKQVQILAANVDHAYLIATPILPRTSTGFIDRFLATAEAYSIPASVIFTKSDLYDEELSAYVMELTQMYNAIGYATYVVSSFDESTLNGLKEKLKNKVSLFSGHSGVGKTSLINALIPGLNLRTAPISEQHLTGKHTTTFAEMTELPFGGFIIDTPGIREFGIVDFNQQEVTHYFPEFFKLLPQCRYNNCIHVNEEGCAVLAALERGEVSASRYHNYISILNNEDIYR